MIIVYLASITYESVQREEVSQIHHLLNSQVTFMKPIGIIEVGIGTSHVAIF
jgi:hypothetical protein